MKKSVSIILPAFNEGENCALMERKLTETFSGLDYDYKIIFINDGSSDNTQNVIERLAAVNDKVKYVSFSKNFGVDPAMKAGSAMSDSDCDIFLDCDLQHPPELIPIMLSKWEEGYDVVYTIRAEDKKLPLLKRKTSNMFYTVSNSVSSVKMEHGASNFRLLSRRVSDIIADLPENEPFIRGLVKWVGFKQTSVDYFPGQRASGETKFSILGLLKLALAGITSFSVRPLYFAIWLGAAMAALGVLATPYVAWSFASGHAISGWTSIMVMIIFFGGVQLLMIGVLGIYIGKIFMQTKHRPIYIVEKTNISK